MTLNLPWQYKSKSRLINLIGYMGRLWDSDIEGVDEFSKFQDVLDKLDSDPKTGIYDTKEKLKMLAPKCEDIALNCKWGGEIIPCMNILKLRETSEGFCCTFNFVRGSNDSVQLPAGIGSEMGLTVLMNLSSVDYFYPLKNFVGATTLIFDPFEMADSATGFVREVPIEKFFETRITLSCVTKRAVKEVQRYSIEKRECLFPTDMKSEFKGNYVYADCLAKCKLRSVLALCKCIHPFNVPTDFSDIDTSYPYCNLNSVGCMNKYKVKWGTFKPRQFMEGLEREMEDSLNCESCYPLCSSTSYIADSTAAQLNFYYENKGSIM
jgi:amiloride-sensitive sodium channel